MIQFIFGARFFVEDRACPLGPDERLRGGVVTIEIIVDRIFQIADAF